MSDERTSTLYAAHRRKLVNFANGLVHDADRAEDIVQEAFIRFREVSLRRPLENPPGFLYRIVRNLAFDIRRRQTLESRYLQPADEDMIAAQACQHQPTPETELAARQELQQLMVAMATMPERTRIALRMHRLEGAKLKDIAARLGVSVTVAHGLVADGVKRCRDSLRQFNGD